MDNREKYSRMNDHDILVTVAVLQEVQTEKLDKVCNQVDDHESRLATREAVCEETRKTIFSEVNLLRNAGMVKIRSVKEKATLGGGALTLVLSIIYGAGKTFGWW